MKIIVTGASGMLGSALCPVLRSQGHEVIATDLFASQDVKFLDITDKANVDALITEANPDIVMHLAAATDVDQCELEPQMAFKSNSLATRNVAEACRENDAVMVYISTSSVFDGSKKAPYVETDTPNPLSVYAKAKLEGEGHVQALLKKYFIIRAGWMIGGGPKDKKFVAKMVDLMRTRKEIFAVTDKKGSPTYTVDFSANVMPLVETGKYGIYHMANRGECTRFEIAQKIAEVLKLDVNVKPATSDMFPAPAPRPASESLYNRKLEGLGINRMRPWEAALEEYLKENFRE